MAELTNSGTVAQAYRRVWEPPALYEVSLFAEQAASNGDVPALLDISHPPPPAAAEKKLGFAIEMAFPLAARSSDK
jgi:hypothetical protein